MEIKRLVLTGGPCGGKTTALAYLSQKLADYGCYTLTPPEIATEFFKSGVKIGGEGLELAVFQEMIIEEQISRESRYLEIAKRLHTAKKRILLFDRGAMDAQAYIGTEQFEKILEAKGYNVSQLRDERYEAVFHLVTAAIDAEEFYTTENNEVRKETLEEARALDHRTKNAWVGHPHLRIIPNVGDFGLKITFEEKKRILLEAVCRSVGIPVSIEEERKFLVAKPDLTKFPRDLTIVRVSIEQIYLRSPEGASRRIRKRGQDGYFVYYLSEKIPIRPGVRSEREEQIRPADYDFRSGDERDDNFDTIVKDRYCFLWEKQYFELDVFQSPPRLQGTVVLELELTEENEVVHLPPFIKVTREVTGDNKFLNMELARKKT